MITTVTQVDIDALSLFRRKIGIGTHPYAALCETLSELNLAGLPSLSAAYNDVWGPWSKSEGDDRANLVLSVSMLPLPELPEPDAVAASWAGVSIADLDLDGEDEKPTIGARTDGLGLIYPGKEHYVAAEPGAGKTWFCALIVSQELAAGGRVLYLDFEDSAKTIVKRMMNVGVPREPLNDAQKFVYVHPDGPAPDGAYAAILARLRPTLVILDGVTEGYGILGLDINDQKHAVSWRQEFVIPANNVGAATLATDHVVKSKEARGGYAIGAQHKKAGLTGAAFELESIEEFGRGKTGRAALYVRKDRGGYLNGQADHKRLGDLILESVPLDGGRDEIKSLRVDPPTENEKIAADLGYDAMVGVQAVREALSIVEWASPFAILAMIRAEKVKKASEGAVRKAVRELAEDGKLMHRNGTSPNGRRTDEYRLPNYEDVRVDRAQFVDTDGVFVAASSAA